ncbi:MAG: TonB-dependent receptor, partial [Glaciecola sp.]|nr:TonB-dependent receptor [Glaciecola sp.]
NTSYKFTPDLMAYFTVSEGFRIGGANGVAACPDNIDTIESQIVCALSNEQVYVADTTTNYEFGVKSSFLRNRLYVNAAFFDIDWQDAQVAGATVNGAQPITANARGAGSDGFELSVRGVLSDELTAYATYSNVNASLTEDAPYLFGVNGDQGTDLQDFYDGKSGDRLSGAPETQVSVGFKYSTEVLDGKALDVVYGLTAQSDVLTKVGGRADGEFVPGFALSNISATIADDSWSVALYVDNLFNKYAYTSVRRDRADLGLGRFESLEPNRVDILRNYGRYVVEPRKIGVKFTYTFDM